MKKVLLVATVQSHICQFHHLLADLLHEHGYEVHAAAKDNLAEKNGLKNDFLDKVFDVPFSRSPKSLDNIKAYRQLKKIIAEGEYDIIHCNTPMGGIITRLVAKKARKHGTEVYYTAHGFHFYEGGPKKNWLIYYPIEKYFSSVTDKLITVASEDYQIASEKFHCPVYRVHGVGVDENRYYPKDVTRKNQLRSELKYSAEQKIILCIGELLPNKNHRMAIKMMAEVVKKYPDTKLLIAGNGPERANLESMITELGLNNNIEMLGYTTSLQDYQCIADLLVSCSFREGLPLNVIEAMMTGNPVVLTENRGHRELIDNGNNGVLVKCDDYVGMAENVMRILADPELYKQYSENAIEFTKKYTFRAVKEELKNIYGVSCS